MSDAISGIGTTFSRLVGSAYVNIAEVSRISGPSMTREVIDVTSFDSVGGYREFIPSLRDPGELTFDMNFTQSGYFALKSDFDSDTVGTYKIVLNDTAATTLVMSGLVTDLPMECPLDDKVTVSVTIKITGQVTVSS